MKEFKQINVLINNAAISGMRPIYGLQKANWEKTSAVNLTGTFLFTKHVWKPMKSQGGGAIINIASTGRAERLSVTRRLLRQQMGADRVSQRQPPKKANPITFASTSSRPAKPIPTSARKLKKTKRRCSPPAIAMACVYFSLQMMRSG